MADDWTIMRLGDVSFKIGSGATPRGGSGVYLSQGTVALIRSQNVYNEGFKRDGLVYLTDDHAAQLSNVEVQEDDVLLNITGDSVARCCQVDPGILPARVNQHVAIIRPNPTKLDPRFLRYALISPIMQEQLLAWAAAGATRNALTKGMIEAIEALAPADPGEQRAIAHILGTLDDKIELNRRMNETLEAMARAVFKSWFVDDVRGRLPKDWHEGKVEELARLSRDTISPSRFPNDIFDHYSIPAYDEGRVPRLEPGDQIKSNKFLVPPNAVLISKLNPQFARLWLPSVTSNRRSVSSTEFLVAIPRQGVSREYLYGLFRSKAFSEVFSRLVTGTSSSHQRVKPEYMLGMDVVIPPARAIERYGEVTRPLFEKMALHLREFSTLTAIRDALLPKLMSGELRVPEAERFLAATRV